MTSQITLKLRFFEKYKIEQIFNVDFEGEGVRKSAKWIELV